MNLVGIRALNAYENTRYQFLSTLVTNIVVVIGSLVAFFILDPEQVVIGLAVAFAISYWVGLFVTDYLLARFVGDLMLSRELGFYLRVSIVAGLAVTLVSLTSRALGHTGNIIELVGVITATTILYFLFARIARIKEVSETVKTILRR
jgi:putative peptidoglycan lipid II flippase